VQTKIRLCRVEFFLKINKHAGKILIHVKDGINVQGEFLLKNNKRADQNKAVQGGVFSSKLINVHARFVTISSRSAS
jgi:hypothetical protein